MIRSLHSLRRVLLAVAAQVILLSSSPGLLAHDGPPYPIFVDEEIEGWTISVWADPDVGTGTFFYYLSPPVGRVVDDVRIRALAVPEDEGGPVAAQLSEASNDGEPFQQIGFLEFSHRGSWSLRLVLETTGEGQQVLGELACSLDVTPPGLGKVDLFWFACPFLLIGGLWLRTLVAQRAYDRTHKNDTPRSTS